MAMTPRLVIVRGRRADGGLALILDVAESVRISIPTTGGQNCRCSGIDDADLEMPRATSLFRFCGLRRSASWSHSSGLVQRDGGS
jgi:hypothetical protein